MGNISTLCQPRSGHESAGPCDLHYREGGTSDDFPFLLGREAAGVVESVGEGVTDVAPGDFVILNWRGGAFADKTPGSVGRGDTVAVIGCGGVGDAAIAGSNLAGAAKIVAVGIDDRKLATAKRLGATRAVNSKETEAVDAVRELTGGFGADVVIDAVGRPETYRQAFCARARSVVVLWRRASVSSGVRRLFSLLTCAFPVAVTRPENRRRSLCDPASACLDNGSGRPAD